MRETAGFLRLSKGRAYVRGVRERDPLPRSFDKLRMRGVGEVPLREPSAQLPGCLPCHNFPSSTTNTKPQQH